MINYYLLKDNGVLVDFIRPHSQPYCGQYLTNSYGFENAVDDYSTLTKIEEDLSELFQLLELKDKISIILDVNMKDNDYYTGINVNSFYWSLSTELDKNFFFSTNISMNPQEVQLFLEDYNCCNRYLLLTLSLIKDIYFEKYQWNINKEKILLKNRLTSDLSIKERNKVNKI